MVCPVVNKTTQMGLGGERRGCVQHSHFTRFQYGFHQLSGVISHTLLHDLDLEPSPVDGIPEISVVALLLEGVDEAEQDDKLAFNHLVRRAFCHEAGIATMKQASELVHDLRLENKVWVSEFVSNFIVD
ncbi:hypothetical protein PG990_003630 [Apiospora arundinis]